MKKEISLIALILCASCASIQTSAIPLGNDMAEIDVSASRISRSDIMQVALQKAAETTLSMGYAKFVIVNDDSWSDTTSGAAITKTVGIAGSHRHAEGKFLVRMFHNDEAGSKNALDAATLINASNL